MHDRLNIVLLTIDSLRADHLGCYGYSRPTSPFLDRLARQGILFEHAYASSSMTAPSHASLFTGLYPPQHGVRVNAYQRVPLDVRTLAERLHDAGYRTGAFVSSIVLARTHQLDQGFDVYDDRTIPVRHSRAQARRPGALTVDAAARWLDDVPAGAPFFLWVHLYDAHAPYAPPETPDPRFAGDPYAQQVAVLDGLVGRLLDHPRIRGDDRLVVALLADHGESLGEHGEQEHGLLAYDATLRIPWIVRAPGVRPGTRIGGWASQVDVLPTVLDLLGLPAEPALRGADLAPLLAGGGRIEPRALYAEELTPFYSFGWARLRAVRSGPWKLLESAGERELYDLDADPGETRDLAAVEPAKTKELADALGSLGTALDRQAEHPESVTPDAKTTERLASLGYVGAAALSPRDDAGRPAPRRVVTVRDDIVRAGGLLYAHRPDDAVTVLRAVLDRDPTNFTALGLLVNALVATAKLDEAVAQATRLRDLDPQNPTRAVRLAELEERRGHRTRALELASEATRLDPTFVPALLQKAALLRADGLADEAADGLRRASRTAPDDVELNLAVARDVELAGGDAAAAEERLTRLVAHAPYASEVWRVLGVAHETAGRPGDAAEAYRRGLAADPDEPALHAALGVLLARTGAPPDAEHEIREAIRLGGDGSAELWTTLGACLADQHRPAEAEEAYARAIALAPRDPVARNARALLWLDAGRTDDARRELIAVTETAPAFADAESNLAAIALRAERWPEAEMHARRALRRGDGAVAWNNLGAALEGQARDTEAEVAYRRALDRDPRYWQARLNLALVAGRRGRAADSVAGLRAVLEQVPGQPDATLQLARLQRARGDTTEDP